MLSDVTEFLYHTAEDLRIHCVASYWPLYFSSKNFLADFGHENVVDFLLKLLKVSIHYDFFCHLSCVCLKLWMDHIRKEFFFYFQRQQKTLHVLLVGTIAILTMSIISKIYILYQDKKFR